MGHRTGEYAHDAGVSSKAPASNGLLWSPIKTVWAHRDIAAIAADQNLLTRSHALAIAVNTRIHAGLLSARTDGLDLFNIIRQRQQK